MKTPIIAGGGAYIPPYSHVVALDAGNVICTSLEADEGIQDYKENNQKTYFNNW